MHQRKFNASHGHVSHSSTAVQETSPWLSTVADTTALLQEAVNTTSATRNLNNSFTTYLPEKTTQDTDPWNLSKMLIEFHSIQLPGIVVSLLILVLTMFSCEIVYRLILHNVIPGVFKGAVLDFIAAGEATVISWELITIFHQYGQPIWAILAYIFIVIKYYRYRADCVSCPYSHIQSYLKGNLALRETAVRILVQFLGGSVFFRGQAYIWDFGLTPIHIGRAYWTSYGRCVAWLADPSWVGFLYEFTGSLICGISTSILFDFELIKRMSIHIRILASSGITVVLVLISFHHTGGFFQPLLAFARTFGCIGVLREVTILDHILVYWIGATMGAVVSMYVAPYIKKLIITIQKRKNKTQSIRVKGIEEALPLYEDHEHKI